MLSFLRSVLKDAPSVVSEISSGLTFGVIQILSAACRTSAVTLNQTGLAKLFKVAEPFAIMIAIIAFGIELSDRREERAARAWQLLTTAAPGNSGKIRALEYLNEEDPEWVRKIWPYAKTKTPLMEIDLRPPAVKVAWDKGLRAERGVRFRDCPERIFLANAKLPGSELYGVKFTCADLDSVNLSAANLNGANLSGARLIDANLIDANLRGADLRGASLIYTDFSRADLQSADFSGAILFEANLSGASLQFARGLSQSQLDEACFENGRPPKNLPNGLVPPTQNCAVEDR